MNRLLNIVVVLIASFLPHTLDAGYVADSPESYAYLAVNRPDEFKEMCKRSSKRSNWESRFEWRLIQNALCSHQFADHKRALERLRDDHIQLTIRNEGLDIVRIGYYKIKDASAATTNNECSRRLHLKPGKKATIRLLKNQSFGYQNNVGCPEDCEQIGDHYHWSEKIKVPFEEGQSIVLGATKSASKKR